MKFFFADDSKRKGAREKLGNVRAFGGVIIAEEVLLPIREEIDQIVSKYSIPKEEEIKWSPFKDSWIYSNLKFKDRENCYLEILNVAKKYDVKVLVVVCAYELARLKSEWGEERCIEYAIERASLHFEKSNTQGMIVCDRPGGNLKEDKKFLSETLEKIEGGKNYVVPKKIPLPALTAPSHLTRHLQLADLVVGITTSMVAGNLEYAENLFEIIKPMFLTNILGTIGGTGLKVIPEELTNLYYWVLGEKVFTKASSGMGWRLPSENLVYGINSGLSSK